VHVAANFQCRASRKVKNPMCFEDSWHSMFQQK
jgi:hypothetical protein